MALANNLGNLAIAHKKLGDYAKAIDLMQEMIKIYKKIALNIS